MKILVSFQKGSLQESFVKDVLKKAYKDLKDKKNIKKEVAEISVAFVSSDTIKKVNSNYRGINKVTDVLSFEDPPEILVCLKAVKKQAKNKKQNLKKEVALVLIHSLLHVFGFDHKKDKKAQEMRRLEQTILSNLNIK